METANVNIRTLQILNDRLAQTIDALNQVRMSVHGISNTSGLVNPLAAQAVYGAPFASYGVMGGIGHTTAGVGYNPIAAQVLAQQALTTNPFAQVWGSPVNPAYLSAGLAHATGQFANNPIFGQVGVDAYQRAVDPYVAQRVSQTFPFAQWGYSPYVNTMF
jgi:hypothetical protein